MGASGHFEGNPATAPIVFRAVNLAYFLSEERARLSRDRTTSSTPSGEGKIWGGVGDGGRIGDEGQAEGNGIGGGRD